MPRLFTAIEIPSEIGQSLGALRGGIVSVFAFAATVLGSWVAFRYSALLIDPTFPAVGIIAYYGEGKTTALLNADCHRSVLSTEDSSPRSASTAP